MMNPDEVELKRLVDELEVHQVELELQNEELQVIHGELERDRNRYHELYELAPVGYLTLDRAGNIRELNLRAGELLGGDRARVSGRPLASFLRPAEADVLLRHLNKVFSSRAKQCCELVFRTGQGRDVPVRIESIAFDDASGGLVGCRSAVIDLSERRSAEASESRSEAILDAMDDAIVSSDMSGHIESFNKAAERLFGYVEAEVLGKHLRMLLPAPDRHEYDGGMARSAGGASFTRKSNETSGLRKNGTTFPLELMIAEWSDRGERKLAAVLQDITERTQREAELRESAAQFRSLADGAPVLLWMVGTDGLCNFFNRTWLEFTGRTLEQELGDGWLASVHPEDLSHCTSTYIDAFAARRPFRMEYRLRRADGQYRWVLDAGIPRWAGDRSPAGYVRAAIDIGDMKQSEIELRQSEQRLRQIAEQVDTTGGHDREQQLRQAQKLEAMGAFASAVAHDFNNVLQDVLGCLSVARDESTSTEHARQYVDHAAGAALRGGELGARLLAFTRKRRAEPRPIDIDSVIESSAMLLGRVVAGRISLRIETHAEGNAIVADPAQIEQILLNLAANARDAMPEGGTLSVRTELILSDSPEAKRRGLTGAERYVRLIVADSGTGMDESTRTRIFDPFFTTKELGKGSGLGLPTVLAVTHQLRGTVDVESTLGRGTSFSVYFPCTERIPTRPSQKIPRAHLLSGTALLVEDEPLVRMTVSRYLEELGLEVLEAASAYEAQRVSATRDGPVDLLLADFALPGMNGSRLAALVKQRYPALRVLFMSANVELAQESLTRLPTRVLRKPFDKAELAVELAALFETVAFHEQASRESRDQKTVLVVANERVASMALEHLLRQSGYRVIAAARPSHALDAAAEHGAPIDLLLADARLPEMNGDELAAQLQRSQPGVRVIFLSGLPRPPVQAAAFVQKPFDFEALLAVIDLALGVG